MISHLLEQNTQAYFVGGLLLLLFLGIFFRFAKARFFPPSAASQVDGPMSLPLLGHLLQMWIFHENSGDMAVAMMRRYGRLWRFVLGGDEFVVCSDPEDIAKIATRSTTRWYKLNAIGDNPMETKYGMEAPVLFDLRGEPWKHRRHFLQRAFDQKHTRALAGNTSALAQKFADRLSTLYGRSAAAFSPTSSDRVLLTSSLERNKENRSPSFLKGAWDFGLSFLPLPTSWIATLSGKKSRKSAKEAAEEGVFDLMPELRRVMMDVMGQTILGRDFGLLEGKESKLAEALEYVVLRMIWDSFLPPFLRESEAKLKENVDIFSGLVREVVAECEGLTDSQLEAKSSILGLLSLAGRGEAAVKLTQAEVCSEVSQFCVAGFDTSKCTLGILFYHLAAHPPVQRRLRAEIREAFPDGVINSVEQLNTLTYLTACMKESQRLQPVAPMLDRVLEEAVTIGESARPVSLPVGTKVIMAVSSAHRYPPEWGEDADLFIPERHLANRGEKEHHRMAFIPFGAGPKLCVGFQVAQMQVKMIAAAVISRLHLTLADPTDRLHLFDSIVLTPRSVRVIATRVEEGEL